MQIIAAFYLFNGICRMQFGSFWVFILQRKMRNGDCRNVGADIHVDVILTCTPTATAFWQQWPSQQVSAPRHDIQSQARGAHTVTRSRPDVQYVLERARAQIPHPQAPCVYYSGSEVFMLQSHWRDYSTAEMVTSKMETRSAISCSDDTL